MTVRMRHTPSHTKNRRSHHALSMKSMARCTKCGADTIPHTMCLNCGYYKNREVVDVLKKLTKRERKAKEQELKTKEEK